VYITLTKFSSDSSGLIASTIELELGLPLAGRWMALAHIYIYKFLIQIEQQDAASVGTPVIASFSLSKRRRTAHPS